MGGLLPACGGEVDIHRDAKGQRAFVRHGFPDAKVATVQRGGACHPGSVVLQRQGERQVDRHRLILDRQAARRDIAVGGGIDISLEGRGGEGLAVEEIGPHRLIGHRPEAQRRDRDRGRYIARFAGLYGVVKCDRGCPVGKAASHDGPELRDLYSNVSQGYPANCGGHGAMYRWRCLRSCHV